METDRQVDAMRGRRILIVEDEFMLASDLAHYFSSLGAEILGPVPSRDQAWPYLATTEIALLDLNLNGEMAFPLADQLANLNIPFVFYTGHDIVIPDRFNDAWMLKKPVTSHQLAVILGSELSNQGGERGIDRGVGDKDIMEILAKLRQNAQVLLTGPMNADALVERALEAAIIEAPSRPKDMPLLLWLTEILERTHLDDGSQRMN